MELILATTNPGKILEIRKVLEGLPITLYSLSDFPNPPEVIEDQNSFEGNALKKARMICRWQGLPALADDSGLVVPALGGQPGIHSARYAGNNANENANENTNDEDNRKKLLKEMEEFPESQRQASFVCVLALVWPDGRQVVTSGECHGVITREERGTSGFGYDPLFLIPRLNKTTAEISLEEKNQISHRGEALRKLREVLLGDSMRKK